ncbi:MAG TPA: hypothetical protein VHX44_10665 [Planctomycetota bacterium]|jgi:hypothetical protein|nr:hypothetical protein [Planctomycetota bacterium]
MIAPMRLLIPALALLIGATGVRLDAATTVEIRVTSGDLITGEIVQESANTIELKRMVVVRHKPIETTVTLQKTNITMRKEVPPLLEQYETRRTNTADSLLTKCALARWCLDRALTDQSLVHTREAEKLDKFSPIVAKLYNDLGYIQVDGAWVDEDEHLASTGKVKVGDTVMSKEDAAVAKEQIIKAGANAHIEQQIRDAEWAIKTNEKKLTEVTERRDKAKADLAKAEADAKGAENRQQQLEKRREARAGKQQNNRTQQQEKDDGQALQEASADASRAAASQKKSEKELKDAEEALARVKATIDKAKAALPELQKQLAAAGGKPADKAGEKTTDKPADKPAEKADKPATDSKPKSRFGGD